MIEIKPLANDEFDVWLPLWKGYQVFYESVIPDDATASTWEKIHDADDPINAFGAYLDGKLVGIVHYIFHRNTWTVNDTCYLNDLFTDNEARGKGVGRALIEAVYAAAKEKECECVYWLTQDHNKTARLLYDNIAEYTGFVHYE